MKLRIVSWNILQGGGKRADAISDALVTLRPDVLVLQEYRNGKTSPAIMRALDALSLEHRHLSDSPAAKNTVLIASRYPMNFSYWHDELDPALAVRSEILVNEISFELLAAHLPHKKAQRPYFECLLDEPYIIEQPAAIIGDLNCGIPFEDSETRTFDNTHLFQSLLHRGWTDSWRIRHASAREYSWVSPKGNGYRYDHCLATASFDSMVLSIHYVHELREQALSDHSALVLEIDPMAT